MQELPLLPTTVIGSWSFPGWYAKFCEDATLHPEWFGPEDREEAVRDAVRLAVDDQLRAGTDLITDGEMQRVDFNLGFYDRLTGIEPLPQGRLWGPPARRNLLARKRIPAAALHHRRAGESAHPGPVHVGRLLARRRHLSGPGQHGRGALAAGQRRDEGARERGSEVSATRRTEFRLPSAAAGAISRHHRPHRARRARQDQHAPLLRQLSRPSRGAAQLSAPLPAPGAHARAPACPRVRQPRNGGN